MAERRPFHETIINIIDRCFMTEMEMVGALIKRTKITENHDKIAALWKIKSDTFFPSLTDGDAFGVIADLMEQKREAEAEAEAEEMAKRDEAMLGEQVRREERLMREDALER